MLIRRPRFKLARAMKRSKDANNYEKMMKTLLLQNQQLIIQQSNVMFIMMKQLSQTNPTVSSSTIGQMATITEAPLVMDSVTASQQQTTNIQAQQIHNQHHSQQHHVNHQQQPDQQKHHNQHQHHHHHQQQQQPRATQQQQQHQILQSTNQLHQQQHIATNQYHQLVGNVATIHSDDLFGGGSGSQQQQEHHHDQHHMDANAMQQVASQLQENLSNYLTPAASEQDPISDKTEDDDLAALLEGNGLLPNNLLYNPQTDIGSVTPYKSQQQQQTPSYYSSGCESLTTPKVEGQKHTPTINVSQNVVKNLADSFKSPSKPKINVQILSGSATGSMKNSKAKIIQRMNITEFLRHVHPETGESKKNGTQ